MAYDEPAHKYKLGAGCDDLLKRGRRHLAAKIEERKQGQSEEYMRVWEEREALAARVKEMEEQYFQSQVKKAAKNKAEQKESA